MPRSMPKSIAKSNATKSRIRRMRGRRKRKLDSSELHPLLQLQHTIGNQAVGRMIQAQLKVGQPGDKFEQEAERVAEQVVNTPESMESQSTTISNSTQGASVQRIPEMEEDKRVLQGSHEAFEGPHEEEEFKPISELIKKAQQQPNRYIQEQTGNWLCPPAEEYAQKYGLNYRK